jgi:hypothetical protein
MIGLFALMDNNQTRRNKHRVQADDTDAAQTGQQDYFL